MLTGLANSTPPTSSSSSAPIRPCVTSKRSALPTCATCKTGKRSALPPSRSPWEQTNHVQRLARLAKVRDLAPADLEPFGIDQCDTNGNTALHLAYRRGHRQAVDRLIALGANQDVHNNRGLVPWQEREVRPAV